MQKRYPQSSKIAFVLSLLAVLLFIFLNSLMSATVSAEQSVAVFSFLDRIIGFLPFLTHHFVRKLAHFAEYALLGAHLFFLPLLLAKAQENAAACRRRLLGANVPAFLARIVFCFALGVCVCTLDECLQLFVPGRYASIADVALDACGVLCGMAFALAVALLYFRSKRKKDNSEKQGGNAMKGIASLWKRMPRFAAIGFLIGIGTALLHVIGIFSSSFSAFLNQTFSAALRVVLGFLTCIFPFSVAELFVVGLPLWIFLLVFFVARFVKKHRNAKRVLCCFLAIVPIVYSLFVFTMGFGYLSPTLYDRLSYEDGDTPTAQELYETVLWLAEEADTLRSQETFAVRADGSTAMPYSYGDMDRFLIDGYEKLSDQYAFVQNYPVGTKRILLSEPMAYTGITGVYSFFTGEANVNTAYPDYATVFTAAHEMAHSRGIAREDEANFIAFLACISAEDPYVRYCGYTNLLQYTVNALWRADKALWKTAYNSISSPILSEFVAYNIYFDRYDDNVVRDVAQSLNNAYLEGMGTQGSVSYGLVVDLAVAYRKSIER